MKNLTKRLKRRLFLHKIKKKPIKILWFPKIEKHENLMRELSRAVWYLNPIIEHIESITFEVEASLINKTYSFSNLVDSSIAAMYIDIKEKFVFTTQAKKTRFDVIVEWSLSKLHKKRKPLMIIRSDVEYHQFDSTKLIKFVALFLMKSEIQKNHKRVQKTLLGIKEKNYSSSLLLGSGPSIDNFTSKNIDNTLTIICNSVVKNTQLLERCNPNIIVATDSVFHAGYSLYASEFRKHLCNVLDKYIECIFMVPLRDLLLYKKNLPSRFSHRVMGIEGINTPNFNLNLLSKLYVKSTSNVLTFFLFPLASTISRKIYFTGFDGKKNDETHMFWSYSNASQFMDIIDNIKRTHPAFYKVDYNAYNQTHLHEVEAIVNDLLQNKYELISLAPSNISILNLLYKDVNINV